MRDRLLLAALRVAWLALPLTAGPALGAALDGRSTPVQNLGTFVLWAAWAVVVVAVLLPRPEGLTALRVAAPGALGATLAAALEGNASTTAAAVAVAWTLATTALAFLPETGSLLVNGGAYGEERRHLLRPPVMMQRGLVPVAWVVLVAAALGGPLIIATRGWLVGVVAAAVGPPVAAVLARALHALSMRWVVFVPAGVVLKDHLALVDPVLFRRQEVEAMAPAGSGGTDALDLTGRARGLALELDLEGPVTLMRVAPGRRGGEQVRTARLLFTPTRPGAVLADAATRLRLRAGSPGPRPAPRPPGTAPRSAQEPPA